MPDAIRQLTLANGLQLTLRHAPRLKRAAAALRVHAGSHDAPARWPGLAHFLEHLFFLGTPRYPLEDGLMRYVQALGGQVNASTRERATDYFFETPPAALAGGLMRLCQMLAEPDLALSRQRDEREVIHAEFIAWARSRQAQEQYALLQSVAAHHPLRAFHAGNRYTLALRDPAFQEALVGFHQRFYQGGQMVLALSGPQSLDELEQVAMPAARLFASGERLAQSPPPPLGTSCNPHVFAYDQMPAGAEHALALLTTCLNDSRPGMWLDAARKHGLQAIKIETLYAFAGQLLWHIDLKLATDRPSEPVLALLHGWFGFLQAADFERLNREFDLLQRRREQSASAVDLARRDSMGHPFTALDTQGQRAFAALIAGLPTNGDGCWQLPASEPLLHTRLPEQAAASLPLGLSFSDALPATRQHAALRVRWRVPSPLGQALYAVLDRALAPLKARCERASVQLQFVTAGQGWELRCAGVDAAVITAVGIALPLLLAPPADCWAGLPMAPSEPMPIRALLERLPDAVAGFDAQPPPGSGQSQAQLDTLWQQATWHGLGVGFEASSQSALAALLQGFPGQGCAPAITPPPSPRRWHKVDGHGSEHALLLFCPLPAGQEATGRLLAYLLQGPVYQRLRVELQLGYAVFSALRQIEGVHGLVIGVQSPHASPAVILDHVVTVLRRQVTLDPRSRQRLADQFDEAVMSNTEVVEWAWQTHLATQPQALEDVRRAILTVRQHDLERLQGELLDGQAPWICLANAAAPPDFHS